MKRSVVLNLLNRLGGLLLTLLLASMAIFAALYLTPGDPVSTLAGGARPTPELVASIRATYHLDDPVWMQYLRWLGGVLSGDLGTSYVYQTSVASLLGGDSRSPSNWWC